MVFLLIEDLADRLVLAHPKKLRVIAEIARKTDKIDAEVLATFLALDMIPEAYRPSPRIRQYRVLVRHPRCGAQRTGRLAAFSRRQGGGRFRRPFAGNPRKRRPTARTFDHQGGIAAVALGDDTSGVAFGCPFASLEPTVSPPATKHRLEEKSDRGRGAAVVVRDVFYAPVGTDLSAGGLNRRGNRSRGGRGLVHFSADKRYFQTNRWPKTWTCPPPAAPRGTVPFSRRESHFA